MKRTTTLPGLLAACLLAAYGCSENDPAQAGGHEDLAAVQGMAGALHHMERYNDSIAHHTGAAVHHYDSLYHHHDSLFVHHHQDYHHGDTIHHHSGTHHDAAQHHEYDSIAQAHHHLAH
ncbi:hypothetical protein OGH69_12505 [Flavobacterium sp. MFBS3-15]|uniref:hypothetical protein n=1 Tax=Flavobacterium sp. MFBS3-15 TaxID=2989816 RepID=UPI002235435C|nr:hypothetical protein [Flavobacterium sp. MFBS3-15]MCW4469793.1 hypothetical protein [Flavobacterium sp. MFBS3-15]